jgi:hypothetical protein
MYTLQACICILAARFASELFIMITLLSRGRRECRVKASPMARLQKEKQAAVTTGAADQPAFPARCLNGLYALSLETGLIASILRQRQRVAQDASTGASGPHDFTVRIEMFVGANDPRCNPTRPPHPAPDVRDDARTSLCMGQDGTNKARFPKKRKRYFGVDSPDRGDRLESVHEMSFSARATMRG